MCAASAAQTVTLAWDANTESNLGGYTVQYGTQAGNPTTSLDVGRVTTRAISGLTAGGTYYFRVRAYNTSGQTSAPSNEVPYTVPGGSTAPTITSISPTSGPVAGGTQIRVNGTRFVSGARVNVQGRAATTTFVSATELRATTPAGTAGAASVQVVNPNNQSATLNNAFTYTSTSGAAPSIGGISPTSGPVSGGTQITITGTNFVSGATVRVGGRAATAIAFVSPSQLRATTPAGAATGSTSVQVVNPSGQSATRGNGFWYTGSATTPTGATPKIDSVTPNSGPLAGGTTITVAGSNFVSGATVRIGSRAATSTTFVSASQLRAQTPAGTATGGFAVVVVNPDGKTATRSNGFWYTGSSTATAAETLAANTLSLEENTLLSAQDVIADASRALTAGPGTAAAPTARYLPLDPDAGSVRSRLALTNAGAAATTAQLTFTDAAGAVTRLTVDLPARQRRTIDARSTPALRTPASVALEASGDVALERLSIADDQAASSLTAAATPAIKWEFATGSTRAPFDLAFAIENPGATDAVVDARYLLPGDREPVTARYTAPAGGRAVIDVRELHPSLADVDVAATFTTSDATPVLVTRTQALAAEQGEARVSETSLGAAEAAATWRVAGDTTGAALSLAIANPGDEAALVEARYTTAEGGLVTRRYDVGAQRRLTVEVAGEDPSLAATAVDVEVESLTGAPVVVERSQWWSAAPSVPSVTSVSPVSSAAASAADDAVSSVAAPTRWTDGLANIGPAAPAARWLLAEAEDGGEDRALTTLRIANASAQAVEARVTLLFEDAGEVSTVVSLGAGESSATPVAKLAPAAAGRRYSILVEAVDGSASLLVDRQLFQLAPDGRVMGGASAGTMVP